MAIYTNGKWAVENKHMVARSSKLRATDAGRIYDVLDDTNAIEQGSNIKLGDFVDGSYQVKTALTPAIGDAIVFVCDVPLIYENYRTADQFEYNFINKAGKETRAYEITEGDIFGVSDYGFTTVADGGSPVKVGNYVTVDGNRKYKEVALAPDNATHGFIGKIVGYEKYQYDTVVLVEVLKNKTVVA